MKALAVILALLLTACGGGGSSVEPVAVVVAAYGDSTQAEQGNPHAATRPGFSIINKGIGSTNTNELAPRWAAEMTKEAQIVVINHGINDRGYPIETYRENLISMVSDAQAAKKIVMLEMPNPSGQSMTPLMVAIRFNIDEFNLRREAMRQIAQSMGVYLCDQPRVPLRDGIHPTAEGYAIKAGRLADCLQDVVG